MTPVNVDRYSQLLEQSGYDPAKSKELVQGFTNGFDLGYRGPKDVTMESNNLKFRVGNKLQLWNKLMKEVKEKRVAGGFLKPPFQHYIQSPLGKALCLNMNIPCIKGNMFNFQFK